MSEEKTLILIPTNHDKIYCLGKFIKNLKSIDLTNTDILFSDDTFNSDEYKKEIESLGFEVIKVTKTIDALNRGEKLNIVRCLANARETLRQEFIKRKQYTKCVWFDSDIIMPHDVIKQLTSHELDLVSGIYWQKKIRSIGKERQQELVPVVYKYLENECYDLNCHKYGSEMTVQELFPNRLIGGPNDDLKIIAIGTGCFMASRKLMEDERWNFRFNPDKPDTTEDMWFCLDLRSLGYEIYLDSRVCCRHWMRPWINKIKTSDNQK